ncbi:MAG TPA: hypothetical protein VFQ42_02140, partial [Mycobacterium sp.]|nr:hypothetical protein [Mycobacterium sp.]
LRRAAIGALVIVYVLAWAIGGAIWTSPPNDIDYYLLPAAQIAVHGHPLLVYRARWQGTSPNDNGPIVLVPLTAVAAVASWLGWLNDERSLRAIVMAAFSIFSLLMAREAVMAIDRLRGTPLRGWPRLLTYGVFAASPTLWQGVLGYGHIDVPITIWLVLYGVRSLASNRPVKAGFSFGVALLTRSIAALQMIPLGIVLLARRRWRAVSWLGGIAALTVFIGLLPFVLADRSNVVYSLLTNRANVPMVRGSLWQLARGTPYEWIAQRDDLLFIVAAAIVLSVIVIRARPDLTAGSRDIYGLLALSALTLPLLTKSVWPYYYVDPYVLGAIWWLGQPGWVLAGRRWLGALLVAVISVLSVVPELGIGNIGPTPRLWEGIGMGVVLLGVMILLTNRLGHSPLERPVS